MYAQIQQSDATSKLRTNDVNYQQAGAVLANWRRSTSCAMLIAFLSRCSWILSSFCWLHQNLQATSWCEVDFGGLLRLLLESSPTLCEPLCQPDIIRMWRCFLTLRCSVLQCIICILRIETVTWPGLLAP